MKRLVLGAALILAAAFTSSEKPALAQASVIPTVSVNGTISGLNQSVVVTGLNGQPYCTPTISGSFVATNAFEATHDGITWTQVNPSPQTTTGTWTSSIASILGYRPIEYRVRASAYTSGTATVSIVCSGVGQASAPIQTGTAITLAFTGAISSSGTTLTFPNGFAFLDTTFLCTAIVQGTSPVALSYDPTQNTTTSAKFYAASGTPTISIHCSR